MSIVSIRKSFVRPDTTITLCATLLTLVVLSGCTDTLSNVHEDSGSHSGEALYRGLFFGEGSVTDDVPLLQDAFAWRGQLSSAQVQTLSAFVDELVTTITKQNPEFFLAFAVELQSGDHLRVQDMLERANEQTMAAIDAMPEVADWRSRIAENESDIQAELIRLHNLGKVGKQELEEAQMQLNLIHSGDEVSAAKRGWALAVVIALAAAVVYPPAVLAVALAIVVAYAWSFASEKPENGGLQYERIVDAIAVSYATGA